MSCSVGLSNCKPFIWVAEPGTTDRQSLEQQAKAEELFSNALQSIRQIAESGSERARDAESAQADAVRRIHRLSNATIVVVMLVGLAVIATGSLVGRRILRMPP
jgi:hypothetical protein